jgi:hypothetical protein
MAMIWPDAIGAAAKPKALVASMAEEATASRLAIVRRPTWNRFMDTAPPL